MKYGDKLIRMEGVIVAVKDGAIDVDLMGRLGFISVPKRMVISERELKVGQTVAWNMSFLEQKSTEINDKYFNNLTVREARRLEILRQYNEEE